jgi:hypothetical protein
MTPLLIPQEITSFAGQGFFDSIRRFSTSAILSVLYGKRAPRFTTPEVTAFFDAQHHWEELMVRTTNNFHGSILNPLIHSNPVPIHQLTLSRS